MVVVVDVLVRYVEHKSELLTSNLPFLEFSVPSTDMSVDEMLSVQDLCLSSK